MLAAGTLVVVTVAPASTAATAVAGQPGDAVAAGIITTIAGGPGAPGPAQAISVDPCGNDQAKPCGLAFADGRLYVTDLGKTSNSSLTGSVVREVSLSTGSLTTPVGIGELGFSGDGGPATAARLASPAGLAVDSAGNLLVADYSNNRIRVVAARTGRFYGRPMIARRIYTIAGDGRPGFSGDGGPATSARMDAPFGLAVDRAGNVVFADSRNSRVRVVTARTGVCYGQHMTAGHIYTIAGGRHVGFAGDHGAATLARLHRPTGIAIDRAGNVLIADSMNNRVRVLAARTARFYGQPMTTDDIYTVAGGGSVVSSGGLAVKTEIGPAGVAVDAHGNVIIASGYAFSYGGGASYGRLQVVPAAPGTFYGQRMKAGHIYTVAGGGTNLTDGVPATSYSLIEPEAVTVDSAGNLVVAQALAKRVRVVAASSGTFYGVPMIAGHIYAIAGNGSAWSSGAGGPALSAQLVPGSVAAGDDGNLAIVTSLAGHHTGAAQVMVMPASTGTFFGQAMTAGHVYLVAGDDNGGFSGDGGPALSAGLASEGAAFDAHGNLLIADTINNRIRVVAASTGTFYGQHMTAADIYTIAGDGTHGYAGDGGPAVAAEFSWPRAVAVDPAGNLVIADFGNQRVRVVAASTGTFYGQAMTAGDAYTIAGGGSGTGNGGPGTGDAISAYGVAVDALGNVVVADNFDDRIWVVAAHAGAFYGQAMTSGDIYTVAGDGTPGSSGDGGPATAAEIDSIGVAVDASGNLVICDLQNRVRVVAASTGTFYGQAMTAGDIYTVAGDGQFGFSGDGGPATSAELDCYALASDAAGIVLACEPDGRVRMVTG
jgi:sugar lactone lactonase YvrE